MQEQASKILHGLYEASRHVELQRLPELFCGFQKTEEAAQPHRIAGAPRSVGRSCRILLYGLSDQADRERAITSQIPVCL